MLAEAEARIEAQESTESIVSDATSLRLTIRGVLKIGQKNYEDSPSCELLEGMRQSIEALEVESRAVS